MNESMQDEKDNIGKLDRMLRQAASEKPVMSIDDVQKLINAPRAVPPKKNLWLASTILLLSVGGIILSVILSNQDTKVIPEENNTGGKSEQKMITSPANSEATTTLSKASTPSSPEIPHLPAEPSTGLTAPKAASVAAPETKATPATLTHYKAYTYYFNKPDHRIEITVVDGKVTELSDNDEMKNPEDYGKYESMIQSAKLKAALEAKQSASEDGNDKARYLEWKLQLTKSLMEDRLIDDPEKYEFSFENNSLVVNGIKQDESLFKKYKLRYEEITGRTVHAGTSLTIRKQ